ncbi:MAG TPA: protein-methionine-sulfoxide reductase heme-binding subunit MsrQ [Magnetospirillaceae bacterium]|nr:protein-methionine-sulfoxide reductase heme-binding subunit MsrQ [Magnetospirillaceae bacterium]
MTALALRLGAERWIRPLAHLACALPLAWLAGRAALDLLGANPVEAAIRFLGDWALRIALLALAVTPLRQVTGFSGLARYRRMLGLWGFAYAVLHLLGYVVLDQFFDWDTIGHEILKHKFITAGMAAFALLLPLAVTSTQGMIKRLGGPAWRRLHRLVYLAVPLAALHYIWMVKAGRTQPSIYLAIALLLLLSRWVYARRR